MIYFVLLLFVCVLFLLSPKYNIIDLYPLYCVFFDVSVRFAGSQQINYQYLQYALVLIFAISYILRYWISFKGDGYIILIASVLFLAIMTIFPIIRGAGIDPSLRSFAINSASILILPISFHYYSHKGNVDNLLKIIGFTAVFWAFATIIFTILKIDTRLTKLGSESFGLGIFYFGEMGSRGALSYIGLFLISYPLVNQKLSGYFRVVYNASCVFLIAIMLISLKRFTLVAVLMATFNYLLNGGINIRKKIGLLLIMVFALSAMLLFTSLPQLVVKSYYNRGAERNFSGDAVQQDVRIYEPLYIIQSSLNEGFFGFLFGSQTTRTFDIESELHYIVGRQIHNQYGQYLLMYGFFGLIVYLSLFGITYRSGVKHIQMLKKTKNDNPVEWVSFQNMTLVFLVGGMVGGHIHVTYRALAFIVMGSFGGRFCLLANKLKNNQEVDNVYPHKRYVDSFNKPTVG